MLQWVVQRYTDSRTLYSSSCAAKQQVQSGCHALSCISQPYIVFHGCMIDQSMQQYIQQQQGLQEDWPANIHCYTDAGTGSKHNLIIAERSEANKRVQCQPTYVYICVG